MATSDEVRSTGEDEGIYCWNCGEQLDSDVSYCPSCGEELSDQETVPDSDVTADGTASDETHPPSRAYRYLFVGLAAFVLMFVIVGAYGEGDPVASVAGIGLFGSFLLLAVAMYRDATYVDQRYDWAPNRRAWAIGAALPYLNVFVVAAYVYRRSKRTTLRWLPWGGDGAVEANAVGHRSVGGVLAFDWMRVGLAVVAFSLYNVLLEAVATDLGTVLVSFVSVWEVTGFGVGGTVTYSITGYSSIGALVSFVLSYLVVSFALASTSATTED